MKTLHRKTNFFKQLNLNPTHIQDIHDKILDHKYPMMGTLILMSVTIFILLIFSAGKEILLIKIISQLILFILELYAWIRLIWVLILLLDSSLREKNTKELNNFFRILDTFLVQILGHAAMILVFWMYDETNGNEIISNLGNEGFNAWIRIIYSIMLLMTGNGISQYYPLVIVAQFYWIILTIQSLLVYSFFIYNFITLINFHWNDTGKNNEKNSIDVDMESSLVNSSSSEFNIS